MLEQLAADIFTALNWKLKVVTFQGKELTIAQAQRILAKGKIEMQTGGTRGHGYRNQ